MSRLRRLLAVAAAVPALAFAACGTSPEDEAHDNGKDVGQALRSISDATSLDQLQAGVKELQDAIGQVADDQSDRIKQQVQVQKDTINQAIGNLRRALGSGDQSTAQTYRNELQGDIQDLRSQAAGFASTRNSVDNSFWDGVRDGYDDT